MGDSQALPGFGQVDLDLEDDPNESRQPAEPRPPESEVRDIREASFGELDFDFDFDRVPRDAPSSPRAEEPPPSTSRVFNTDRRPTRQNLAAANDESTRIVSSETRDALVASIRPPSPLVDDGNTRAWSEVDDALLAVGDDDAPTSTRSKQPSGGSGVASRDGRVAAMRELYARGDADGALALATEVSESLRPPGLPALPTGDHPDASIVVELGEESIDLSDPFGGLIPLEDDLAVPRPAASAVTAAPAAPQRRTVAPAPAPVRLPRLDPLPAARPVATVATLTLTERQSIPRVLTSRAELSKLKIDHRAGFLLAHVDGMQTLEEILDICAMPPSEALELIANLKKMGVIEFE